VIASFRAISAIFPGTSVCARPPAGTVTIPALTGNAMIHRLSIIGEQSSFERALSRPET
jgi:hypothetical protein